MKQFTVLILFCFLLFSQIAGMNSKAQGCRSDIDRDGVCDTVDRCPTEAGPASNDGCPRRDTNEDSDGDGILDPNDRCPTVRGIAAFDGCPAPDQDGDGTPDGQDRCVDRGGPAWNSGCPEGENGETPTNSCANLRSPLGCDNNNSSPQEPMPETGRCVLATRYPDRVNIRIRPSTQAEIVAQLTPNTFAPVLQTMETFEGRWYRLAQGWVFANVVRFGGNCNPDNRSTNSDDTSKETIECPSFVGLSPVNVTVAGQTLFVWTSPIEVETAFYQINIFDINSNWLYDTFTFEPTTQVIIDLSAANIGMQAVFTWNVIALDMDEEPLCATEIYTAHTGMTLIGAGPVPECANFYGVSPMTELGSLSTDFMWTTIEPALHYQLKLYNDDNNIVAEIYTMAGGDYGGYSVVTSPEAIGDSENWHWSVDAFLPNWQLLCSTETYLLNQAEETGETPDIGNPEGLCDTFVLLSPDDNTSIAENIDLLAVSWHHLNAPVQVAYIVYAGVSEAEMHPFFSTTGNTGNIMLWAFQEMLDAPSFRWKVEAVSLQNPNRVLCSTPLATIYRESSANGGNTRPNRGVNFPTTNLGGLIDWACPKVEVLIFSDSVPSSYFQWNGTPGAVAYRLNLYNADDAFVTSYDMAGFVEVLVTQLPFGAKDDFSFDLQLLMANQAVLCTSQHYHVERDFEPTGGIRPVTLNLSECANFNPIAPLAKSGDFLGSDFTVFGWTAIADVVRYDVFVYNSADQLVNSYWSIPYAESGNPEAHVYMTDVATLGAGNQFSWQVRATLSNDLQCASDKVTVNRPQGQLDIIVPEVGIGVVNLELAECAGFEIVSPLDFLGAGLYTYFQWTDVPEAVHYDLKIYNANDVLVFWGYIPANHASAIQDSYYFTTEEQLGTGLAFSWEVIASLNNGLACTTERVPISRQVLRQTVPPIHIKIWDLTDIEGNEDGYVDPDTYNAGDICRRFLNMPTDQNEGFRSIAERFGFDFCRNLNDVGDPTGLNNRQDNPLAQCGAVDYFMPENGFVNVLEMRGAVDYFIPNGESVGLNFCNPLGINGQATPDALMLFLDAESLGYEMKGTVVFVIIIKHAPENSGIVLGHAAIFIPEDSELNFSHFQQQLADLLINAPEITDGIITDGTLDGYLIGLLHDAGLETLEDGALNFAALQKALLNVGGIDPNILMGIIVDYMTP